MKAVVLKQAGAGLLFQEVPDPRPAAGQVLIRLHAAAINHRDLWISKGQYPGTAYPCILGSDGAGVVEGLGQGVGTHMLGQQVLINPSLFWGDQRAGQGREFQILGVPSQGTFAEYICVPGENVFPIPEGYDFEKAASLPLAGLTAHRALFYRGDLKAGQKLLITGIGGGVSGFLLGFAVRAGASVYVTSSADGKIRKAVESGAFGGTNYHDSHWDQKLAQIEPEGFDLIVDGAGGPAFTRLIGLLKTGGKIVSFGRTAGNIPEMSPALLFYKQASVLGTTMGSPADFQSMLEFIEDHNMRPIIDRTFRLEEAGKAMQYLESGEQYGKVVLKIKD